MDSVLYGCYDAGGLHIFDVTNGSSPRALGRYANPALLNKPRAYNGVVIQGGFAFVAVSSQLFNILFEILMMCNSQGALWFWRTSSNAHNALFVLLNVFLCGFRWTTVDWR